MKEFLFLSGQIRGLQSKLITQPQLDRMIGAATPEDAFRVLVELQYAEYIDESVRPQDFQKIIQQGLLETRQLIQAGTDDDDAFNFVWKEIDLNSLKRALKIKLVEGKTELGEYTEANGFSEYGEIDAQEMEDIIWRGESMDDVPREYREVLEQADAILKKSGAFRDVEFALDRAHFNFLDRIARTSGHTFLRKYLTFLATTTNVRSISRSVLIDGQALPEGGFVPHSALKWDEVKSIDSLEKLTEVLKRHEWITQADQLDMTLPQAEQLLHLERRIDKEKERFLLESESGEVGAIQIPIAYLEKRLRNARRIKFIMFAKFYGIDADTIYKTLKNL